MPPDAPTNTGKEQINDVMKPVFDQMNLNITIHSIDETKVSGDLGLTRCTYTLELIPKAGGETVDVMPDGKALTLYERQSDGNWKINSLTGLSRHQRISVNDRSWSNTATN